LKILLTGAAGMLASAIMREIESEGIAVFGSSINIGKSDIHLRLADIQKIDVRVLEDVSDWAKSEKPDFIFHLAAETDVDLCEKSPEHAYRTNYIGTENVALVCQKHDIPLLYISTGAVFNGRSGEPYTEFDEPEPINVYGRSKLAGEIAVQRFVKKYFIIRAGWMIGGWEIDKKYVFKIVRQLLEGRKEIRAVNDKFGSPTFTADFARNLLPLIKTERYGLYHMANKGSASRYDIAVKIAELMNLNKSVRVNPVNSAEFPLPAPRPRSEMLSNCHLDLIGMNDMPHWEDALRRYILDNVKAFPEAVK
jgi:dTDP-4-dehydrorhamnose reductase